MLMTQVILLLASSKANIKFTSILISIIQPVFITSTWVTKAHLHMMQVCSIAHMFHCNSSVQSVKTHSNQRLDSRLATAWSQIHSQKVQQEASAPLMLIRMCTTALSLLRISCKIIRDEILFERGASAPLFF